MARIKVFFSCSGVGILDRGIETFFREAFNGLRSLAELDLTLYKGAGEEKADEHVLWNVPRTAGLGRFLGKLINRDSYVVEQHSFLLPLIRRIRAERPDIVFTSDGNLLRRLFQFRKQIGVPFHLLFSNGGPVDPPYPFADYVHQVAPYYYEQALAAGVSPDRQSMVPYGITIPDRVPDISAEAKHRLRVQLGLPEDRKIVLSVGWITAQHKRMDYLVSEVAALPQPRPYLVLLGAMDASSRAIVELANAKLGPSGFTARTISYQDIAMYYQAADIFALASLKEGFGRVFLEALIHGLPVTAHKHPVMEFVLDGQATLADLTKQGALAAALICLLHREGNDGASAIVRRESVRRRFSWEVLSPDYLKMFLVCARARSSS